MKQLSHIMPTIDRKHPNYFYLADLWKELGKYYPDVIYYPAEQNEKKRLTVLVQQILGKPLNKSNQFSMWNNRGLRQEQIEYASLV